MCSKCYACKGHYTTENVVNAHEQRRKAITDPRWVDAMVAQILLHADRYFRWFDSGDVQSDAHADQICTIARRTPSIRHYLPSQEHGIWERARKQGKIPENLIIRLSGIKIGKRRNLRAFLTSMAINATKSSWQELVATNDKQLFHCPAPLQTNKCMDCRACWNSEIKTVAYRQH